MNIEDIKLKWQKHNRDNGMSWNEVAELVNEVSGFYRHKHDKPAVSDDGFWCSDCPRKNYSLQPQPDAQQSDDYRKITKNIG